MNGLKLVIGSPNASSWSLRPWLLLKQLRLPFEEIVIPLRQPDTGERIRVYSPSGKVPVLLADGLRIWDSLAIAEYLAEDHPELWPSDRATRALARAACNEMHSGFADLRTFLPMDFTARFDPPGRLLAPVERDVERIVALWAECRRAAPESGPFLFGRFTIADAMFAPVCSRFVTYAVRLPSAAEAYVGQMMGLPAMRDWGRLAQAELSAGGAFPTAQTSERSQPAPAPPPPVSARAPEPLLPSVPEPPPPSGPESTSAEDPMRRGSRPIPSTIMIKPIGDGTRRRR
jgi:glutathione S-transferase